MKRKSIIDLPQPAIKGIIGTDIDGTISWDGSPVDQSIIEYFKKLNDAGWQIIFATGRTREWTFRHLSQCAFPHFAAVLNGASVWKRIPYSGEGLDFHEEEIDSHSISRDSMSRVISPFCIRFGGALIYEGGMRERIFALKKWANRAIYDHVLKRKERQREEWIWIDSIDDLPSDVSAVSSMRFFTEIDSLEDRIIYPELQSLAREYAFSAPSMKDSFNSSLRIIQVTAESATKGCAIESLKEMYGNLPVIAIGDDANDLSMLKAADYAIGIQGIEPSLAAHCDMITHSATPVGVIAALDAAISAIFHLEHES